jgi:predicted ATP-grasp superfamily ATP-dependent carboligase|tara:strand:+ start:423 stop:878 length:456 start_codon:yes stop_codon:yes gene_type:complete
MATGENDGTWGAQTNDNMNRVEDAVSGYATVAISGNTTLTFTTQPTSYADENGRNKILVFTGTPGATATITLPDIEANYFVQNDTDSSLIFQSGSNAVTYTLVSGRDAAIYIDGSDEVHNALANLDVTTINGIDPANSATKGFATAMAIAL